MAFLEHVPGKGSGPQGPVLQHSVPMFLPYLSYGQSNGPVYDRLIVGPPCSPAAKRWSKDTQGAMVIYDRLRIRVRSHWPDSQAQGHC